MPAEEGKPHPLLPAMAVISAGGVPVLVRGRKKAASAFSTCPMALSASAIPAAVSKR
jgi:hypothetical protein